MLQQGLSDKQIRCLWVWDVPSGTLLHRLECDRLVKIQWSWTDQYLLLKAWDGNPRYLNAETFQEEVLKHPCDHFQPPKPNPLYWDGRMLRIRLSSGRVGPLFSALPSNLDVKYIASQGDRACIHSSSGQLL